MFGQLRIRILFIAAMMAAPAAVSLPAQGQERTVNFYNWSNYMAPGVLEQFTKETGIKGRLRHVRTPTRPWKRA